MKKFHGVGPATAERMKRLGIETGADLRERPLAFLQQHFGKSGAYFYGIARGIDHRMVRPDRVRKSIGAEDTFAEDIHQLEPARAELRPLAEKVWRHCEAHGLSARTVTVKVKYQDFNQATRSRTLVHPVTGTGDILDAADALLETVYPFRKGVRLIGVTLSNLVSPGAAADSRQLDLAL